MHVTIVEEPVFLTKLTIYYNSNGFNKDYIQKCISIYLMDNVSEDQLKDLEQYIYLAKSKDNRVGLYEIVQKYIIESDLKGCELYF